MPTRIRDQNIVRVYVATFFLGLAYGLAISLIAIFLDDAGYGKEEIGWLATAFASGIVVMSVPAGGLIRRYSAKVTLVAALAAYAATVAAFPFLTSFFQIAVVRFVDGASSVTVWVSCETILLARAGVTDKAHVTSLYAVALAIGYVVGPLMARLIISTAPLMVALVVAGIIAAGTSAYVAMRLERTETGGDDAGLRSDTDAKTEGSTALVLSRIKTSCFATYAYGYFQASVVLFLPLYLIGEKGIPKESTVLVPAFFAVGMLLFANVAGRVGDRVGHLRVMRILAIVGTSMILGFVLLDSFEPMCFAVFVAGASLASISPVSLALQGLVVSSEDYSRATSFYNAFYAAGMLMGPPISSVLFNRWGGDVMLYHLAAMWVGFVVFALLFRHDDPAYRPQIAPA